MSYLYMLVLLEIEILMPVVTLLKLLHNLISYLATCWLSTNGLFVRINSHFYKVLASQASLGLFLMSSLPKGEMMCTKLV
jgi:hypothetical protein